MCGLCGSTQDRHGRRVQAMLAHLVHRGPDDEGVHLDPSGAALGARRLSVIDVAGGHQPVRNEDGTVWAAHNGEVFNHEALHRRLARRGHDLRSRCDTEVLVHLYEELGERLVHALEGMYAFAVWDARRRRLLLARDRFGEKPLFFCHRDGRLDFASELRALAAGLDHVPDLDHDAVDAFFVLGYVPGDRSLLDGVRQLPPGHLLVWEAAAPDRLRIERYWELPLRPDAGPESAEEVAEEAERLLDRAVGRRMVADVPLGVFLSGGVDSALVAALAARRASSLKTFTVTYAEGDVGEHAAAGHTARVLGADHHELVLHGGELAQRSAALLRDLDQPLADPALVALNAVAAFARPQITVALGGEASDELFGGYPRYAWLQAAGRLDAVLPGAVAHPLAGALRRRGGRVARGADVVGPRPLAERHLDWVTAGRRAARGQLYGPALRGRDVALDDLAELLADAPERSPAARLMRLDAERWLPGDVLVKADRATMRASLEMRTPFLDRELAEFAASVPPALLLGLRGGKQPVRRVLRRVAPEVERRPKTAFRVPLAAWLRAELRDVTSALPDGPAARRGLFDAAALRDLTAGHLAGRDHAAVLWPIVCLDAWLAAVGA